MYIIIANLNKDTAGFGEQITGHYQAVAQVGQVRMDTQLPGIPEGFDLLWLAGGILSLAVFNISFAGADLPV